MSGEPDSAELGNAGPGGPRPASVGVRAVGSYLPATVVGNDAIAAWSGAPPDWIVRRTGITERRYAGTGETTSDLALHACLDVLAQCPQVEPEDLELIVLGTSTPDQPQPATAAILQHKLGLHDMPAFDLNAVCTGFLYGLCVAQSWLAHRNPRGHALVVGADRYSTLMDRTDRRTVSLFGDGAGAVLLGPVPAGHGIRASRMATHGEYRDLVEVVAGGTREPVTAEALAQGRHLFRMDGRAVKEYALKNVSGLVAGVLADAGLSLDEISHVVCHQGNPRLVEAIADELGVDPRRVPIVADRYGNTAASSIPITLAVLDRQGLLARGQHVLLAGVGGGMTAGAALLTWH